MFVSSSVALLMLVLLAGASAVAEPCPPSGGTAEGRCVELTANDTDDAREVQLSPGLTTTLLFNSKLAKVELEGRQKFRTVREGEDIITLVPSEEMRGEEPSKMTVCFADDAAPACATFRLVIHPAVAERQVEIFRHKRPVESYQAELKRTNEEVERLRAEIARLRAENDRPAGLIGLLDSGMMDDKGIASRDIVESVTQRPTNALTAWRGISFRALDRVALELDLKNPDGAEPWLTSGAILVGPKGEELKASIMQPEPILPGKKGRVRIEVAAPVARTQGPFLLKLWEVDGPRIITLGNVTFPALPVGPGL